MKEFGHCEIEEWTTGKVVNIKISYLQPMKLYKYHQDFGRMGELHGVFALTQEEFDKLQEKGDVYLGEVLGKHSDVVAYFDSNTMKELTDDQEFIAKAIEYDLIPSGINPLRYIEE